MIFRTGQTIVSDRRWTSVCPMADAPFTVAERYAMRSRILLWISWIFMGISLMLPGLV